jgi:hypothetical protein
MRDRKREVAAARAADRAIKFLPRGGEVRPAALRSFRRLSVPPHRATSDTLGGAYPFLAEAGLGSEGVLIGQDSWSGASFCFDPWVLYGKGVLTNPNCLLAGVVGKGKSTLAKSMAIRSIAFGRRVYVPGDPKGEWTVVAKAIGGQAIELGPGRPTRLNPLDEGPVSSLDADRREVVTSRRRELMRAMAETALGRPLQAVEMTALLVALDTAVASNTTPLLPHVVNAMFDPPHAVPGATLEQLCEDGRAAAHALNRLVCGDLAGLFDGPSTERFDPSLPMVSLDLSRIQGSDTSIGLVMTCTSAWMEAALGGTSAGQRWVIYDEAWRLMRQPALLARMQSQWKLSRAFGIANLLIIHRLSDLRAVGDTDSMARNLAEGLLADCSTRILYNQERDQLAATKSLLGLTDAQAAEVGQLATGEGLWRVGDRAFVVRHLCTEGELDLTDTNASMCE